VQIVALALVLPSLLLHGLIPVGFMPMAADGRLEIAVCPGTVDAATFIAALRDAHAQHHHQDHRSPACPYALSGSAMPPPALLAQAIPALRTQEPRPVAAIVFFAPAIARVQLPRGPPLRS
jgi:hypothetical protein